MDELVCAGSCEEVFSLQLVQLLEAIYTFLNITRHFLKRGCFTVEFNPRINSNII